MLDPKDKEKLNQISSCFRLLPGFMFGKDTNNQFFSATKEAVDFFGYRTVDHMLGSDDYHLPCDAVRLADTFRKHDEQVRSKKRPMKLLEVVSNAEDSLQIFSVEKSPLISSSGVVLGVVGQAIELSDQSFLGAIHQLLEIDRGFLSRRQFSYNINDMDGELTRAQKECLFYTLRGKTAKSIARVTARGHRTVEAHLDAIKRKLDCRTKSELIEKAISLGYLDMIPDHLLNRQLSLVLKS